MLPLSWKQPTAHTYCTPISLQCWHRDSTCRPSFREIVTRLDASIEATSFRPWSHQYLPIIYCSIYCFTRWVWREVGWSSSSRPRPPRKERGGSSHGRRTLEKTLQSITHAHTFPGLSHTLIITLSHTLSIVCTIIYTIIFTVTRHRTQPQTLTTHTPHTFETHTTYTRNFDEVLLHYAGEPQEGVTSQWTQQTLWFFACNTD